MEAPNQLKLSYFSKYILKKTIHAQLDPLFQPVSLAQLKLQISQQVRVSTNNKDVASTQKQQLLDKISSNQFLTRVFDVLLNFPLFEKDSETTEALCNALSLAPIFEKQLRQNHSKGIQKHLTRLITASIFYASITGNDDDAMSNGSVDDGSVLNLPMLRKASALVSSEKGIDQMFVSIKTCNSYTELPPAVVALVDYTLKNRVRHLLRLMKDPDKFRRFCKLYESLPKRIILQLIKRNFLETGSSMTLRFLLMRPFGYGSNLLQRLIGMTMGAKATEKKIKAVKAMITEHSSRQPNLLSTVMSQYEENKGRGFKLLPYILSHCGVDDSELKLRQLIGELLLLLQQQNEIKGILEICGTPEFCTLLETLFPKVQTRLFKTIISNKNSGFYVFVKNLFRTWEKVIQILKTPLTEEQHFKALLTQVEQVAESLFEILKRVGLNDFDKVWHDTLRYVLRIYNNSTIDFDTDVMISQVGDDKEKEVISSFMSLLNDYYFRRRTSLMKLKKPALDLEIEQKLTMELSTTILKDAFPFDSQYLLSNHGGAAEADCITPMQCIYSLQLAFDSENQQALRDLGYRKIHVNLGTSNKNGLFLWYLTGGIDPCISGLQPINGLHIVQELKKESLEKVHEHLSQPFVRIARKIGSQKHVYLYYTRRTSDADPIMPLKEINSMIETKSKPSQADPVVKMKLEIMKASGYVRCGNEELNGTLLPDKRYGIGARVIQFLPSVVLSKQELVTLWLKR